MGKSTTHQQSMSSTRTEWSADPLQQVSRCEGPGCLLTPIRRSSMTEHWVGSRPGGGEQFHHFLGPASASLSPGHWLFILKFDSWLQDGCCSSTHHILT